MFEQAIKIWTNEQLDGLQHIIMQIVSYFQKSLDFYHVAALLLRYNLKELLFELLIFDQLSIEIQERAIIATFCTSIRLDDLSTTLKIWYHQ